jgi:hypothetical protein
MSGKNIATNNDPEKIIVAKAMSSTRNMKNLAIGEQIIS